ncbi:MAG: hypothetical protein U0R80_09290 [Nocardioidaceae bacterium]
MNPYTTSPATMLTIAAMLNDEDVARAERRRLARDARTARHTELRRRARSARPHRRRRPWTRVAVRLRLAH